MGKNSGPKNKTVRFDPSLNPQIAKTPRFANEESSENLSPTWQFSIMDLDGPWGWSGVDCALVKTHLGKLENGCWADIRNAKHGKNGKSNSHWVEPHQLSQQARQRLKRLGHDDAASLYSLRVAGKIRVWGIRDQRCFSLLWWDPNHTVWPD